VCALRSDAERFFISEDECGARQRHNDSSLMTKDDELCDNDNHFYTGEIAPMRSMGSESFPSVRGCQQKQLPFSE